jgi:AcrR family transcriptional regulator
MNNSFTGGVDVADYRLKAVYDAASRLFVERGYERTQVSQIAEKAGIATGTVYSLFSGKKSILHFVLLCTFDKRSLDRDFVLPVEEAETALIIENLSQVGNGLLSRLDGKTPEGRPELTFADMLSLIFDYAANYQVAFNIINDNRSALEEVERAYKQHVNRLYRVIEENLTQYIARGEVRSVELPALHIRNIVEGITWWSMHLPYQAPHIDVPIAKAKDIALDILKHAYLATP